MIRKILIIIFYLFPFISWSQDYSDTWEAYFSCLNIIDISQGDGKIYAASDNAIFTYDINTNEIETITTVNGLSGEDISTIHYSSAYGLLLIGYKNGLIEVVSNTNQEVLRVIDIVEKSTISASDKRINHFNELNDVVYVSTGYGISVYNLSNLEFGDTYYIGNLGAQINVNQTTIYNNFIYASSNSGLRKALVSGTNLIDYQAWELVSANNTFGVQTVENKLYVVRPNRNLYELVNDAFVLKNTYDTNIVKIKNIDGNLSVTTLDQTFLYTSNFTAITSVSMPADLEINYTSTAFIEPYVFIGTTANINQGKTAKGVLMFNINDLSTYEEVHPQGPLHNTIFSLKALDNELWLTYGDYDVYYNPHPLTQRGISHLIEEEWVNIPYDSVFGATDLNTISVNPDNTSQVFISSFHKGLLEVNNNIPTKLFDDTNSPLESLILASNLTYKSIRVSGTTFDSDGVLWNVTSMVDKALKSYNPSSGQWQTFSFKALIEDPLNDNLGFGDLVIDNANNKWIASYEKGLVGVKTNGSNFDIKNIMGDEGEGNLPSDYITALALDNNNQLWIGTFLGLRVLYNPESVFTGETTAVNSIIISEDGVAEELMYQQFISDIKIDGSNNKWIGTYDAGLFYLSENGQETIYHFTKSNSPLPSNNITDISIDGSNGKVYIGTEKGLVAFKSGSSKSSTTLNEAYVYPNPVRPTFNINDEKVKIAGLSENINIKITDIEGNLVAEAQSNTNLRHRGYNLEIDGGTAFWNGKNLVNNTVASGVYLILISDLDTLDTKVLKLMVVR